MTSYPWLKPLSAAVEKERDRIFAAEEYLWRHPATGYREWQASEYLAGQFEALGYRLRRAGDIPGFTADLNTGRPGPWVAVIGELDAVLCPRHPDADPETGAVHACGHHAQGAALLGAAAVLSQSRFIEPLCGGVRLMAAPAEELLELSYREGLRREGVIGYYGGKVEFLRRGFFDGVDMALMLHTGGPAGTLLAAPGGNGCILKNLRFTGKAAHAGGAPHAGVNALYAANLGFSAVNALRETFREQDYIRFHPIVTSGGEAVNVIPDSVTAESYVRGATLEAFSRENRKINRALAGAAAAMGAGLTVSDRPGYLPLRNDPELWSMVRDVAERFTGPGKAISGTRWDTGCTDMGDISCVMPALQPMVGGSEGQAHGADYRISDRESACVLAAKVLAASVCSLLEDGGARAARVIEHRQPLFAGYADYFRAVDALMADYEAVAYPGDGSVILKA